MSPADRYTGAFVLQLGPGTDVRAGRLVGRVEHVASTRSARFRSLNELLAALAEFLNDASRPREACLPNDPPAPGCAADGSTLPRQPEEHHP